MDGNKLRDLNLSNDEISRLEKAFTNNKFRDMFAQYLKEIQDPENQKVLEDEIIELEKQQGNDVLLIKPIPYYVLKTSVQDTKAYINFACSTNVNKMTSEPAEKNSVHGLNLSIPYSLSPMRKIRDKRNRSCNVYSIVFHPKTLNEAYKNDALKKAVQETAFSSIEKTFNVQLDKVNLRTSKKTSKGPLQMTIVKRNSVPDLKRDTFAMIGVDYQELSPRTSSDYVTPFYKIKYRNEVDLQNSTTDKYCKMDILIPKQVIIEIQLPLLKSIQDTKLEVRCTSVELKNEDPKYKLQLELPYEVNENSGSAKFDSDSRLLTLEMDVKKKNVVSEKQELVQEMSSNVAPLTNDLDTSNSLPIGYEQTGETETSFLNTNIKYKLPDYICNQHKNELAFTLKVKNVVRSSLEHLVFKTGDGFWVKFYSLGSGHFPMYYSMRILFTETLNIRSPIDYKIEDDYVFLYAHLKENSQPSKYSVGVDSNQMQKKFLNELDVFEVKLKNKELTEQKVKLEVTEMNEEKVVINIRAVTIETDSSAALKVKQIRSPEIKEELLFENQKLTNMKFEKFCDKFHTQFTLDEDSQSHSEPELKLQSVPSRQCSTADAENESWIAKEKVGTNKIHKKKKARDKKLLIEESIVEDDVANVNEEVEVTNIESSNCIATSQPIDIKSAYRYSDLSGRSILKKNRSFSESSGDESFYTDYSRSYSVDEINFSSDSCGMSMSGPKKTVTFNDVISKKLFSSDISILEQRKRQKRRSQRKERRASDSENSETESNSASKERSENVRVYNETLLSETSETDLTSSLSESGGESSDDQSEPSENTQNGIKRSSKKQQPIPSSKKVHKRRGKKSARKNASTAKHQHHDDSVF